MWGIFLVVWFHAIVWLLFTAISSLLNKLQAQFELEFKNVKIAMQESRSSGEEHSSDERIQESLERFKTEIEVIEKTLRVDG